MTEETRSVIVSLATLNHMRATHYQKVGKVMSSTESTVADLVELESANAKILDFEIAITPRAERTEVPDYLTTKEYADILGISMSTAYRRLRAGKLIAEKIQGRWRIYTSPALMDEVA